MSGINSMMLGSYNVPAAAGGGGVDSDTSLLLHFDGTMGSSTFTDSSANGYVFVRGSDANAANITTTKKRFGTGCPDTTEADVVGHTAAFRTMCAELVNG
jgi:hypothetical protein